MFFEGKARAARETRRLAGWHAWHAGMIARAAKPPSLDDLLGPDADGEKRPKRKQTPEEQLSIAMAWNAKLGGKVIYRDTA